MIRILAALPVLLFTCSAAVALQEQRARDPFPDLATFINDERQSRQLPGLAAVIVRSDGPPRVVVSGERRVGKGDPITAADRMHLGSLTKGITSTMIATLVEKQQMTFETTIGQTFPELSTKMQPPYRHVSVRQLLAHAAGLPTYGTTQSLRWLSFLQGTPTEQRYKFVEMVLAQPPRFEPGTKHEYSSAGAAVAGAMAERISGVSYRQLVQQLVFGPLGGTATFGNPGLASEPQPWGHTRSTIAGAVTEVLPDNVIYTTPLAIEPAGGASPSMHDYGRFLQLHLRGLRGRDDVLKAATIQDLHGIVTPANPVRRPGLGFNAMPRSGVQSHEHFGSSGAYVAYVTIQPSRDVAVAAFTNVGGGQDLRDAVARIALQLATRVAEPSSR